MSENPECSECGKEITKPPAGKNLTGKGIRRGGKIFCSPHCEIEDWWNEPSIENAMVNL